ncbi:MAG: hypothetical protein P1V81_09365 [Planctomycetota bacterium]|nr:hypothetical protein [Planctomycetota bacterium]
MTLPPALVAALFAAAPLASPIDDAADFRRPVPGDCEVCEAKPRAMEALDIVSHGEFAFGGSGTAEVSELFRGIPIRWVEGAHLKLGFAEVEYDSWWGGGEAAKSGQRSSRQGAGGMAEMATGALAKSPWRKTHTYFERLEVTYARMLELLERSDADFPTIDEDGLLVLPAGHGRRYMGEGPHLGMAGKFEVLVLPGADQHRAYQVDRRGLDGAEGLLHLVGSTDAMTLTVHQMGGALWDDEILHGHLVHMLAHALVDSYRHHSYPGPVWLSAGTAHLLERETTMEFDTFCGQHPSTLDLPGLRDWTARARKLATSGKAPGLEELMGRGALTDMTLDDHITSWSKVRFLVDAHPGVFASLNDDIRGLTQGKLPCDPEDLRQAHRDAIARHLGLTYAEFDDAWAKWAKKQTKRG